jgi:hypothetical protein
MSTNTLTPRCTLPAQDAMEYLKILSVFPGQNDDSIPLNAMQVDVFNNQVPDIFEQIDDNVCLVEYFNFNRELLNIRSFINRGGVQNLAESIIGSGLVTGSQYIVVLRNRKSGIVMLKLHDRHLIKYLLSGFNNLGTVLLDYIINREGTIFSAKEAGILKRSKAL